MGSLAEFQNAFVQTVVGRNPNAERRLVDDFLANTRRLPIDKRLRIYSDAYGIRLVNALAQQYPLTLKAVGGEAFESISVGYLKEHPSNSWTLRDIGRDFADYLVAVPEADERPYLPDLARIEWAYVEAFDAEEIPPVSKEALAEIPPVEWPNLRFRAVPSLHRLSVGFSLAPMLEALEEDRFQPMPETEPSRWLVWRSFGAVKRWEVEKPISEAMDKVFAGATFEEICETLHGGDDAQAAADASQHILTLIESRLLAWGDAK